jgi:hypothetical protein
MASSGSIDGEAKVVGHVQDLLGTRMDGNTSVGAADGARRYDGKGSSSILPDSLQLALPVRISD